MSHANLPFSWHLKGRIVGIPNFAFYSISISPKEKMFVKGWFVNRRGEVISAQALLLNMGGQFPFHISFTGNPHGVSSLIHKIMHVVFSGTLAIKKCLRILYSRAYHRVDKQEITVHASWLKLYKRSRSSNSQVYPWKIALLFGFHFPIKCRQRNLH